MKSFNFTPARIKALASWKKQTSSLQFFLFLFFWCKGSQSSLAAFTLLEDKRLEQILGHAGVRGLQSWRNVVYQLLSSFLAKKCPLHNQGHRVTGQCLWREHDKRFKKIFRGITLLKANGPICAEKIQKLSRNQINLMFRQGAVCSENIFTEWSFI